MNAEVSAKVTAEETAQESKHPFRQYVWALGHGTNKIPIGQLVDSRYRVVAPSIWLDMQPTQPPKLPEQVPSFAVPYLKAYPYRLNLPGVYGICHQDSGEAVLLLDNVPVNEKGQLMSAIAKAWPAATAFRQLYWLWQMISLWQPLQSMGAAASLLKKSNVRVEGWRVRLIGLSTKPATPSYEDLASAWEQIFLPGAQPATATLIKSVCADLRSPTPDLNTIIEKVNAQLLIAAASKTVELQVSGATSTGPTQPHNEDACYPSKAELKRTGAADLPLLPRLAIVCDGVGGHDGGEVASQKVVRSLQLQLRGLLAEAMEQPQAIPPSVVIDQIGAAIRVANNLLTQQNDEQGREARQRMGTTLVMALVLPQRIDTPNGPAEVNELYLTHIGDSRAYWMTADHCQLLTVDDDIAGREISAGNSFAASARQRPDADSLTQALGVMDYTQLRPHTQRFLFESSGVLMLCSDGLSDNQQVEASWANYIGLVMQQIVPLDTAVDAWIELANQKNGHDNVSVVLMNVAMEGEVEEVAVNGNGERPVNLQSQQAQPIAKPIPPEADATQTSVPVAEMTPASRALLYGEDEDEDAPLTPEEEAEVNPNAKEGSTKSQSFVTALLAAIVIGVVGLVGVLLWRTFEPAGDDIPPAAEDATSFFEKEGADNV